MLQRKYHKLLYPDVLYASIYTLQEEAWYHERKIYGFFDLLGDLGGVTEIIMLVFGLFLYPISEHSFILEAANKLYFARTKDNNMFRTNPKPNLEG